MASSVPIRAARVAIAAALVGAALSPAAASAQVDPDAEASPSASAVPELPTVPPETSASAADWPVPHGDLRAHRNARESAISSDTLDRLAPAWAFDLTAAGFFGTVTANPIVAGDTVYIQDMQSNIFALAREDGSLRWQADYGIGSIGPNGVTVGYGHVYAGLSDTAEVVALDAESGEEVWRQRIGSPPGEGIDMAPIAYDGLIYISTVPGTSIGPTFYQDGDRGVLYALDALSGEVAWWFDTTNGAWDVPRNAGGGGLWYPPSFDDDGNIYFGVGNPAPWPLTPDCPNGECRPGPNEYTSSMVSLDGQTGGVRWFYQDRPHDLLDLDFQHTPILARVEIDGSETPLAIGAGKTGNVVAVNADSGKVIWKTPVGRHQNDELADLPEDPIEVYPGSYGGVETPIAYADGTVFVTWVDLPQYQGATGPDPERSADFANATGGILAIDATDGKIVWQTDIPTFVLGAATVANDVVFTAGLDGFVRGFDVASGEERWSWEAELGINAPLAIAGDTIYVAPGFVKLPPAGEERDAPLAEPPGDSQGAAEEAAPDGETAVAQLIALRIDGAGEAPAASAAPAESQTPQTEAPSESHAPQASEAPQGSQAPQPSGAPVESQAPQPSAAPPESQPPTESQAPQGSAAVAMVDIAFEPAEVTVPADTDATIELVNEGAAIHNFNVDELGIESGDFQPGDAGSVTVNAAAGDYTYYCSIPGHREAGMVGRLHVEG